MLRRVIMKVSMTFPPSSRHLSYMYAHIHDVSVFMFRFLSRAASAPRARAGTRTLIPKIGASVSKSRTTPAALAPEPVSPCLSQQSVPMPFVSVCLTMSCTHRLFVGYGGRTEEGPL